MGDILQRLLDAEAAGIGEAAGRIALIIGPGRETALAETAHAIGLVLADHRLFVGRHEHQRIVRRLPGIDEALAEPLAGARQIAFGDEIFLAADAHFELGMMVAGRRGRTGRSDRHTTDLTSLMRIYTP